MTRKTEPESAGPWRERVDKNLARDHVAGCSGKGCHCTYRTTLTLPGGKQKRVSIDGSLTPRQAIEEKGRLMSAARDKRQAAKANPTVEAVLAGADQADERAPILRDSFQHLMNEEWEIKASTRATYETTYRLCLDAHLGHFAVDELTGLHAKAAYDACRELVRAGKLGANRVDTKMLGLLKRIVDGWTQVRGLRNPIPDFKPKPMRRETWVSADKALDWDQYLKLRDSMPYASETRAMVLIATQTMCRAGEIAALRWDNFDAENAVLRIEEAVEPHGPKQVSTVKTDRRGRPKADYVAISSSLRDELLAFKEANTTPTAPPWYFMFPGRAPRGHYPKPPRGEVPLRSTSISRRIRVAVKAAQLVDEDGKPITTTHGLRATGGSIVNDEEGVDVASRMLRHTRTATTEASYVHRRNVEPQRRGAAVWDRG